MQLRKILTIPIIPQVVARALSMLEVFAEEDHHTHAKAPQLTKVVNVEQKLPVLVYMEHTKVPARLPVAAAEHIARVMHRVVNVLTMKKWTQTVIV